MDAPARVFEEAPPIPYVRRARFVSRWYRWRGYLQAGAGLLLIALLSGGGYAFSLRTAATKVTVDQAVQQFRAQAHANGVTKATTTTTTDRGVDGTAGRAVASRRGPTQAASSVTRPAVPASKAAPSPYALPPEGVYTYRTSGGEDISIAGAHHDYPAESTATVRHVGGCRWRMENDVIAEHTDVRVFCSRTKDLYQVEQGRWVSFYGKRDGQDFTFTPPQLVSDIGDAVGAKSSAIGRDNSGNEVRIQRTYLGRVPIVIGGVSVAAVRVHLSGTTSGKSQGGFTDDLWLDPATGLTLRWDRTVDAVADATFGARVHYTENAHFLLESLKPKT